MTKHYSFLQCTLKLLITLGLGSLSLLSHGQNEPAAETASSSVSSTAPTAKPIYANTNDRDTTLLANELTNLAKADELEWLATPNGKILALYKAAETAKTTGVLLIIHATGEPQRWPANLENLRLNLPLYGWATMALSVPPKYNLNIPERLASSASSVPAESTSSSSDNSSSINNNSSSTSSNITTNAMSSSAASETPLIPRDKLITEHVDAAITQLNLLGQFNVVALIDNSSAPDALANLYKKTNNSVTTGTITGAIQALILVNLQDQEPLSREQLKAIFSITNLPVLDVFFSPENTALNELMRTHHAEAMRQNLKDYQQLLLPSMPSVTTDDVQSFWLGKVHGFITSRADGNEVGRGKKTKNIDMQ